MANDKSWWFTFDRSYVQFCRARFFPKCVVQNFRLTLEIVFTACSRWSRCAYGLWAVLQKVLRNSGFIYWHCENWKKFCTLNLGGRGCILRDRRNTFRHVSLFSLRFRVAGAALVACRRCWFDESLARLRARVAMSRVSEAVAGVAFCDCGGNFAKNDMLRPTSEHCIRKIPRKFWPFSCQVWKLEEVSHECLFRACDLEKVSRKTAPFT